MKKELHNKKLKVAIQGYEGCFHQQAANLYYDQSVDVICCDTFRELIFVAKESRTCDAAIMAIENSIAGSILPNYNLLQSSNLIIAGEIFLEINQNLMVNKDVSLDDIREVHSHTMALQQCYDYLDQYKWKLVETEDTALSAKKIATYKSKHIAAIASELAAKLYGLKIIKKNIQSLKNNYTRFLILMRSEDVLDVVDCNKASVNFQTENVQGSLSQVLSIISDEGVNLSKLQSFPIPGSDFKYQFHADMEFDSLQDFERLSKKIKNKTMFYKIYGTYKKGLWK